MIFIRKELGREAKQIEEDFMMTSALSPEEHMVYEQFYQRVQKGIEQLPPKCKKVFMMSRFEGKPLKEIARIQNISIRTVESHISKALGIDRKSTRLNSSHVAISYAAYCLKKKIKRTG